MRLLFFAGSTREGSFNKKLARLAQHIATANGIEGVFVDLKDYPMPLYNGDLEAEQGPPQKAQEFKSLLGEYQGVFIASPEYNASITPLIKNTIDWISVVRERGEPQLAVYQNRVFALGGASPGRSGAMQSLLALRQVLAVGCRALVLAEQVSVPNAEQAFDEMDELRDTRAAEQLKLVVRKLVDTARLLSSGRALA